MREAVLLGCCKGTPDRRSLTQRKRRDEQAPHDGPTQPGESQMDDYLADVRKFAQNVDEAAVAAIVKHCGIALRSADSALVATSDPEELATVREGFATKKLGLSPEAADVGVKAAVLKMKPAARKSRVTFYYLVAEATGTLNKLT
jgi:hypothetical protein